MSYVRGLWQCYLHFTDEPTKLQQSKQMMKLVSSVPQMYSQVSSYCIILSHIYLCRQIDKVKVNSGNQPSQGKFFLHISQYPNDIASPSKTSSKRFLLRGFPFVSSSTHLYYHPIIHIMCTFSSPHFVWLFFLRS